MSRYIRLKHADKDGNCKCVTCGIVKPWKELQAGHFVDSRNLTVLFDEELIYPQCVACNMFKHGNKVEYTLFMLRKGYSAEEITEMVNKKFKTRKISDAEYLEMIDDLEDKLVGLAMGREEDGYI